MVKYISVYYMLSCSLPRPVLFMLLSLPDYDLFILIVASISTVPLIFTIGVMTINKSRRKIAR